MERRFDVEQLLREAEMLHQRVTSLVNGSPAREHEERPRVFSAPVPLVDVTNGRVNAFSPTKDWTALIDRGRALTDRLKNFRFDLPPPSTSSEKNDVQVDPEKMDEGDEFDDVISHLDENEARLFHRINDELSQPTLRPIPRVEPGLLPFKNDPVRRYELYKKEWAKFTIPGENKRLALRWKIREQMLRIDLPMTGLNSKKPSQ